MPGSAMRERLVRAVAVDAATAAGGSVDDQLARAGEIVDQLLVGRTLASRMDFLGIQGEAVERMRS